MCRAIASRDSSSRSIYDSVEAFLAHHRHSVRHRHAVTRTNAPPLVPEAAVSPPAPSPPPSPSPRADLVPEDLVSLPASPTPAELEDACADINDRAVREASEAGADAPVRALRALRAALRLHERARRKRVATRQSRFVSEASSASETKRRAAVAAALHGNAASILLGAHASDRERWPDAPRRALEHALLACDADVAAGADADAASASIDVVADAFEAHGNRHEMELHRARAEAVREAKRRRRR